jgi:hypothetical protein
MNGQVACQALYLSEYGCQAWAEFTMSIKGRTTVNRTTTTLFLIKSTANNQEQLTVENITHIKQVNPTVPFVYRIDRNLVPRPVPARMKIAAAFNLRFVF